MRTIAALRDLCSRGETGTAAARGRAPCPFCASGELHPLHREHLKGVCGLNSRAARLLDDPGTGAISFRANKASRAGLQGNEPLPPEHRLPGLRHPGQAHREQPAGAGRHREDAQAHHRKGYLRIEKKLKRFAEEVASTWTTWTSCCGRGRRGDIEVTGGSNGRRKRGRQKPTTVNANVDGNREEHNCDKLLCRMHLHEKERNGSRTLDVWQHAHRLVLTVYRITKDYPAEERFAWSRRCDGPAVSVARTSRRVQEARDRDKTNSITLHKAHWRS